MFMFFLPKLYDLVRDNGSFCSLFHPMHLPYLASPIHIMNYYAPFVVYLQHT